MIRRRPHGQNSASRRPVIATVALTAALLVSGCSALDDFGWFGEDQERLPGERIAILSNERTLQADVAPSDVNILLPAPTPNAEWPMAGGYANHAMHHIAVRDNLQEVWSVDIGAGADDELQFIGSPIIANNTVFAMDTESEVSAYRLEDGDELWSTDLESEIDDDGHIGGGIGYEAGRVFVATGYGAIIALDATTGDVLWNTNIAIPLRSAPTIRDGRVYVVSVENRLHALNAATGDTEWTHSGGQETAKLLGAASPAVDGETVYVPYSSGELYALSASDGEVLWQDNLISVRRTDAVASLAQIRGRPVADRGVVIAVSHAGIMAAIDERSGRRLWTRELGSLASPWVAGDYIFAITNENELVAVSRDDGQILWVRGLPLFEDPQDREDPIVWSGPILVTDRLIVAGSHGEALAVSPYTGRVLGGVELPDGVSVAPISAGGYVVFLANDAELVAFR